MKLVFKSRSQLPPIGIIALLGQTTEANIFPVTKDDTFNIEGYYKVTEESDPYQDEDGEWKISAVTIVSNESRDSIKGSDTKVRREERDKLIEQEAWRYERHAREVRLELTHTDDITLLDTYVQSLADVPSQEGFPREVTWPIKP